MTLTLSVEAPQLSATCRSPATAWKLGGVLGACVSAPAPGACGVAETAAGAEAFPAASTALTW